MIERLHVAWLGGATAAVSGARFGGRNWPGWLRWSRIAAVAVADVRRTRGTKTCPVAGSAPWD